MATIFRKTSPLKYTLEIPCKIRINSKDGKTFQKIIEDLYKELINNDKSFQSHNLYDNEGYKALIKNLYYWLEKNLHYRLDKILNSQIDPDSKKIRYHIGNLELKEGSLVLTFTILFSFIEIYKNIDDIIDFFLEDFSNYINFILDQYEVIYQYYLPFNLSRVSTDSSHNKKKYIKNIIFPIIISGIFAFLIPTIIIENSKDDLKRIINEELIKYKNQEIINELDNYYKIQQYFSIHKANEPLQKIDSIK